MQASQLSSQTLPKLVQPTNGDNHSDQDGSGRVPHHRTEEGEEEYIISAYGDISLSEVQVPVLPPPKGTSSLETGAMRPRLRLRVRRPPLPKYRMSFTYAPDPFPLDPASPIDTDDGWPGSPRPVVGTPHWHQPLVSPISSGPRGLAGSTSRLHELTKENDDPSFDKFFDGLLPSSPSIRLSPPGSPANGARYLPQEMDRRNIFGRNEGMSPVPQSPSAHPPRQEKPKPTPWRTRLPPRLPIPKWDP